MDTELTQLRRRHAELVADMDRVLATATAGTAALVAVTTAVGTAGTMFALKPVGIACAETEGSAPSFTPAADGFVALHLGGTAPPVGTYVIVVQIGGLWQFQF